jgi:hypothetical protein
MYSFDTNINTAVERQAERVSAAKSYGSGHTAEAWTDETPGQANGRTLKALVALAAAAPVVLLALGLMAR